MSVLALAIVNNHNTPVLIRTRNSDDSTSTDLLFKLHSSLDVVEEKQNNREPFLGILTQSDTYRIYGLCSATNNKILLMVNNGSIRDNEVRAILKTIYNIYVDVTSANPFYKHGQPIQSQILNKITPEKFDKLSQELLDLGLESQDVLKRVLLLIFNKALDDYKYSCMYAKLCKVINENLSKYYEQTDKKNIFKILLLAKCKEEFENRRKAFESFENQDAPLSIDGEEKRALAKQKMLGNIKFICELGKQQLLPKNILHECIKQLLSKKKNQSSKDKTQDLECLCEIMKNIGKLLEVNEDARGYLDQYFDRMEIYSKSSEINSRIKFMLLDVIELRKNDWVPRQKDVLQSSVSEKTIENRDNGMLGMSHYGTLYPMPLSRHPFMNQARVNDVFSTQVPIGPIYLGTGPGAINDTNFSSLNNQRRSNYGQKNSGYGTSGPGGGGGPGGIGGAGVNYGHHHHHHQMMNSMGKRDNNYNNNNMNNVGRQNNYNTSTNHQQQNSGTNASYNNYPSSSMSNGGGNNNPMMNQRDLPPSNLPPRFQKQIKQNIGGGNNQGFQSFMKQPDQDRMMNKQPMNHQHHQNSFMSNKTSDRRDYGNNRQNQSGSSYNKAQTSTFNKFLNMNNNNRLNGARDGQDAIQLTNDMNQMKVEDNHDDNSMTANKDQTNDSPVNVVFEIEKLLLEYYQSEDLQPVINYLKKVNVNFDEILISIMRISIGKMEKERELTNTLINKIKLDAVVDEQTFILALKSLFSMINELEVETPRARSHVAGFIANAITENVITLKEIGDLLDGGLHYPLFPLILQNLHKSEGQTKLFDMFTDSKINLMQMVPENDRNKERMADILEDRNLTFLYPMLRIESDITKQITSDCSPNSLFRWLKENVNATLQNSTEFIQVVFSTLLKHIIAKHNNPDNPFQFTAQLFASQDTELKKYRQVLQVFLTGKHDLQLVVLYSLQTFCHQHNFPKGLIEKWFNMLYEHEIVDEEVFFKWREDINDEYPGKGKALFQVNKWLTWLEEDDDEEE